MIDVFRFAPFRAERFLTFVRNDGELCGHAYSKKETIVNIVKSYPKTSLYKVNPSAIVNLTMLKGKTQGTRSKTLEIQFKPKYHEIIPKADLEKLIVTRNNINDFKTQLKKFQADDVQI